MTSSKIYSGIRVVLLIAVCLMAVMNFSKADQRLCGSKLRNVIELMCPNGVNGYKTKRSSLTSDDDLSIENTEEDFNIGLSLDMLPLLTSSMENSGVAKIRRRRHGIAHQCCDKPCSTKEVLAYCRN